MHVVVAGCGRVGAALASSLDAEGHDVVIIDKRPEAFARLEEGFGGRTLRGIVFDRDTLEDAGIAQAHAFVAVTNGDNSNIVSARTAQERYHVEHVVARIYDPERARIYERLGIVTVASARWTVEEIRRGLLPSSEHLEALGIGAGEVVVVNAELPAAASGADVRSFSKPGRWEVVAITRQGRTAVPPEGALVGAGDRVHFAVEREAVAALREHVAGLGSDRR